MVQAARTPLRPCTLGDVALNAINAMVYALVIGTVLTANHFHQLMTDIAKANRADDLCQATANISVCSIRRRGGTGLSEGQWGSPIRKTGEPMPTGPPRLMDRMKKTTPSPLANTTG